MSETTTMTIRLDADLREKLDRIAKLTRRSRSYLAAEAVSDYIERELDIIEGIQRGLDNLDDESQFVSHDEAMNALDSAAEAAAARGRS